MNKEARDIYIKAFEEELEKVANWVKDVRGKLQANLAAAQPTFGQTNPHATSALKRMTTQRAKLPKVVQKKTEKYWNKLKTKWGAQF